MAGGGTPGGGKPRGGIPGKPGGIGIPAGSGNDMTPGGAAENRDYEIGLSKVAQTSYRK